MIDLDKEHFDFQCPQCSFYNEIYFKQARLMDTIICRGCKANIRLNDQMNECRKVQRSFRRAFQKLETSLKDLSIKIEF